MKSLWKKRRNEKPEEETEETRGIPEESIKLDTTGTSVRVSYLRLISAMWPAKDAVSACVCVSEEKPKQWLEAKLSNKRKLAADLQLATYILLIYALYMKDNEKIHAKIFEVSEFLLIAGSDSPGHRKQGGDRKFHFAFRQWLLAFRVFLTFVTVPEPYCQVHTKADEEKAKEEATFICHLCIQGKQDLMKQHSFPWNKFIVVYLSGYSSRKRRFVWLVCFACFFCFVCIVCSVCFVCLPGCLPTAGRGRCWEGIGLEPFSGAYAMGQVAKRWTGWLLKAVSARSKVSQIHPNSKYAEAIYFILIGLGFETWFTFTSFACLVLGSDGEGRRVRRRFALMVTCVMHRVLHIAELVTSPFWQHLMSYSPWPLRCFDACDVRK